MGALGDLVTRELYKVHEILFGDLLLAVDNTGAMRTFNCLMEDFVRVSAEQISIDASGIRDIEIRTVYAHNTHLQEQGIDLEATDYFIDVNGRRWDYSDEDMIARCTVPIDGSQCITQFRMRKSEELNQTESEDEFTWQS